jgi:4'-phosphopantetheinyl transferase
LSSFIDVPTWAASPEHVVIASGEAHVWRASTSPPAGVLERIVASLPPDEHARHARLRHGAAAREYAIGRALLRTVLSRILDVPAGEIRFAYTAAGKPSLGGTGLLDARFSVSHASGEVVVVAAIDRDVGIDIERDRHVDIEGIERRLFQRATQRLLEAIRGEERRLAFLHAWTQREAVVKAFGGRLFTTPDPFPFLWPRPSRAIRSAGAGVNSDLWSLVVPPLPHEGVATVVAAGAIERVVLWTADIEALV